MFINEKIPLSRRKCGVYHVDGKTYANKFHALSNCKNGKWPRFDFNDNVFANYDFSVEPTEDLYELYKRRAIQLREKYDNVIIYFSGGIDSLVIMRTFLDNNLKIDGVVVVGTWSLDSKLPTKNFNTLEQNLVAVPLLKAMEKKYNVKLNVRFLDVTESFYNYKDENYVWSLGGNLVGPRMYAWNFIWKDSWLQEFLMRGSTCSIKGIDKPRVFIEDGYWKFGFLDTMVNDGTPSGELDFKHDWDAQEYFFWTPDLPEIVIKQSHIMVNYLENKCDRATLKKIAVKDSSVDRGKFNKYADPLLYGRYVEQPIGGDKTYFSLSKPLSPGLIEKDLWFHQLADKETKQQYSVWMAGINLLQKKIDKKYFNSGKTVLKTSNDQQFNKKFNAIKNEYHLHDMIAPTSQTDNHIIFGSVGCWSPLYTIKKSKFNLHD